MADAKSELKELNRIGATPVKNSGRGRHAKGDGQIFHNGDSLFTTDVKEYAKSFGLSQNVWAKLGADVIENRSRAGCLQVVLGSEEPRTRLVVLSEKMFKEMLEVYMEATNG